MTRTLLAAALLVLAACNNSSTPANVDIKGDSSTGVNLFSPASVTLNKGDSVSFSSISGTHNVTFSTVPAGADKPTLGIGLLTPGSVPTKRVLNIAGEYDYYCSFHSNGTTGMTGKIIVK